MSETSMGQRVGIGLPLVLAAGLVVWAVGDSASTEVPAGRREVVFWHFWGGQERAVVDEVVARFNASQNEHFVRALAMPGHNLDLKFFLSVAGGNPPDLLNQDDPVLADWMHRGVIIPIDELATAEELAELDQWLVPPAKALGSYDGRLCGLCNGLDIRALFVNQSMLDEFGLTAPTTIAELDHLATTIAPPSQRGPRQRFGFLPDPRRLWAWGIVFGGRFYDEQSGEVLVDSEPIVRALEWMASYSGMYGADEVAAFRKGDQALTGAASPLLQGRYAAVMDGQWRVAELAAAQEQDRMLNRPVRQFRVVPLPVPPGGVENAGWVNGNFFVVPRGASNPQGAWEFMKFWSGFGGHEAEAARTCAAGGWIPASEQVVQQQAFQAYLEQYPEFRVLVELASSPNQVPTPSVPGAGYFYNEVVRAAEEALYLGRDPREALESAATRIRRHLTSLRRTTALAPSPSTNTVAALSEVGR